MTTSHSEIDENALVQDNLGLVRHIATKIVGKYHPDMADILQVGQMGLLKGIRKYDPDRNTKLSTFVARPIYWSIMTFLKKNTANKLRTGPCIDLETVNHELFDVLDGLTEEERYIIVQYHIFNQSKSSISKDLGMNWKRFNKVHNSAKDKIIDVYKDA